MRTFDKYKKNLKLEGDYIMSYNTQVAKIFWGQEVVELGKWSSTTSKHVNYASKELGLTLIKY